MPLREPRLEMDRQEINVLLGWDDSPSGSTLATIAKFVQTISTTGFELINGFFVYNRGEVLLEDTERRDKRCWMISIWSAPIGEPNAECLFQQPVPIKLRYAD